MATMIPEAPHNFEPASQEGLMFDALKKLPDDYYVFHSYRISAVDNNVFYESETDFVIYNRKKGMLCLEAKAGQISYSGGYWRYGSGVPMKNGGPFNQASANKWKLMKRFEKAGEGAFLDKCKFLHAVWFPSIGRRYLASLDLPDEADINIILTQEALEDPTSYIETIFEINLPNQIKTEVSVKESQRIIRKVLCPEFNVFPTASFDADLKKMAFHKLLNEQASILNFLDEQQTAVISGAAGTGKTMIAVEKALRHAANDERVLFLCYNVKLQEYLQNHYKHSYIDYYTLPGFACKVCDTAKPDYGKLKSKLEDYYLSERFPYKHVLVDEGQDFGMDDIEEADILQIIKDIITDSRDSTGSFYVFYDKLQLIQSRSVPKYIEDAECRITLHRNCRNTENIAITSLKPVTEKKPRLKEGGIVGVPANIHFVSAEDVGAKVDDLISRIKTAGIEDIVVLSCKGENRGLLTSDIEQGLYKKKVPFSTVRKFKGLEADAVILVDVDSESFNSDNVLLFYVGASRARIRLDIAANLDDDACMDLLINRFDHTGKIRRPKKELAAALKALGHIE